MPDPILVVDHLTVSYGSGFGPALSDVSLSIAPGERVAIVGESGSGKSTLLRAILGMLPAEATVSGAVICDGRSVHDGASDELVTLRGSVVSLIPQDPASNLDPLIRIGPQVTEGPASRGLVSRRERRSFATSLLRRSGVDNAETVEQRYPHELSGGLRQRALIANGISGAPRLLLADEPTSALDVTVQKRILHTLDELVTQTGASLLLITHDLGIAASHADRIIVLRGGRIVEQGTAHAVVTAPVSGYAQALVAAVPSVTGPSLIDDSDLAPSRPVLLEVTGVTKSFTGRDTNGRQQRTVAASDVSFTVRAGETVAIVGESGSGKTTTANLVLGLETPDSGHIVVDGVDVTGFTSPAARKLRPAVQPVFQDPSRSLDTRFTVAQAIGEPLAVNRIGSATERRRRVEELAGLVSLPVDRLDRRVTELSGGQKQRVAIARALALNPRLLVCDEAVSALDVLVQEQILTLFAELQRRTGVSILFITHDLGVVRRIAHRVVVMRHGQILEQGPSGAVLHAPAHDYTKELLAAVPELPAAG
ncbi:MAG: ABC transporter ATP-binding protein [Mycetocola sp.]